MFAPTLALLGGLGYLGTGYANKQITEVERKFNLIPENLDELTSWDAMKKIFQGFSTNSDRLAQDSALMAGMDPDKRERYLKELESSTVSQQYALDNKIAHHTYQAKALLVSLGITGISAAAMVFLPLPLKALLGLGSVAATTGTNVVLRQDRDFLMFLTQIRRSVLNGEFGLNGPLKNIFTSLEAKLTPQYLRTTSPQEVLATLKGEGDNNQLKVLSLVLGVYLKERISTTEITRGDKALSDLWNPLEHIAGYFTSNIQYHSNINHGIAKALYSTLAGYVKPHFDLDTELAKLHDVRRSNKANILSASA